MIQKKGGVIESPNSSVPRINGLAMSRAMGDLDNNKISE
jgi:hypothetical protein